MSLPSVKKMYEAVSNGLPGFEGGARCPTCRRDVIFAQVAGRFREAAVARPVAESCSDGIEPDHTEVRGSTPLIQPVG